MARRSPMEGGPRGSQGRVTTGEPAGRRGTGNPGRGTTGYYPGWGAMGEPVTVETGSHGRGGQCRPAEKDFQRAEKALLPRPSMIEQAPAILSGGARQRIMVTGAHASNCGATCTMSASTPFRTGPCMHTADESAPADQPTGGPFWHTWAPMHPCTRGV